LEQTQRAKKSTIGPRAGVRPSLVYFVRRGEVHFAVAALEIALADMFLVQAFSGRKVELSMHVQVIALMGVYIGFKLVEGGAAVSSRAHILIMPVKAEIGL
jgi:hypothetical protein